MATATIGQYTDSLLSSCAEQILAPIGSYFVNALAESAATEAARRDNHGVVVVVLVKLGETRLDVAANSLDIERRELRAQRRLTPQRARANDTSLGQLFERVDAVRLVLGVDNRRVLWTLALANRREHKSWRQSRWHIFERVHSEARTARQQVLLQRHIHDELSDRRGVQLLAPARRTSRLLVNSPDAVCVPSSLRWRSSTWSPIVSCWPTMNSTPG
jgi:hypothetical protein